MQDFALRIDNMHELRFGARATLAGGTMSTECKLCEAGSYGSGSGERVRTGERRGLEANFFYFACLRCEIVWLNTVGVRWDSVF